jgi:mannonate dehydratase
MIRQQTATPLAVGETFNSVFDCTDLIKDQLIDLVRMSTAQAGGLSHLKTVAAFADVFDVRMACHSPSDVSPISVSAAVHLRTAIPNFSIQEHVDYPAEVAEVFQDFYRFDGEWLTVGDEPGCFYFVGKLEKWEASMRIVPSMALILFGVFFLSSNQKENGPGGR